MEKIWSAVLCRRFCFAAVAPTKNKAAEKATQSKVAVLPRYAKGPTGPVVRFLLLINDSSLLKSRCLFPGLCYPHSPLFGCGGRVCMMLWVFIATGFTGALSIVFL